jgi:hypothetical protein
MEILLLEKEPSITRIFCELDKGMKQGGEEEEGAAGKRKGTYE